MNLAAGIASLTGIDFKDYGVTSGIDWISSQNPDSYEIKF